MTRDELEHLIRASAAVTDQYEFVIVGSQSILGAIPNPDAVFTMSAEADIYPLTAPELADRIDGAIGEGSQFHETYGYYAQGVGPDTAILPSGWQQRLHRVQSAATNGRVGYCLDLIDLFLSKAAAGRDKDRCSALRFCSTRMCRLRTRLSGCQTCRSTTTANVACGRPSHAGPGPPDYFDRPS